MGLFHNEIYFRTNTKRADAAAADALHIVSTVELIEMKFAGSAVLIREMQGSRRTENCNAGRAPVE